MTKLRLAIVDDHGMFRSGVRSEIRETVDIVAEAEDVIGIIRADARGYVTKNISGPELLDAIARVAVGDAEFSPRVAKELFIEDQNAGATALKKFREQGAAHPIEAVGKGLRGGFDSDYVDGSASR